MLKAILRNSLSSAGFELRRLPPYDARRKLGWKRLKELSRIHSDPCLDGNTTNILGPPLHYFGGAALASLLQEIWFREIYRFDFSGESPRILDCGANIGLASLYFKQQFPHARITAFEPEPRIFRALTDNLAAFGCSDVQCVNSAVWICEGELAFSVDPASTGGRLTQAAAAQTTKVSTVDLAKYLDESIDFLKIDIEGAEIPVLEHIADKLERVQQLFIEYHHRVDAPQDLHRLLEILAMHDMRTHLEANAIHPQSPLIDHVSHKGFDLLVNIFATRDHSREDRSCNDK